MAITIYGLSDPNNELIRYIGKTINMNKRYRQHICESLAGKRKSKKNSWLNSLLIKGVNPKVHIIDVVSDDNGNYYERSYIKLFKSAGCNLLNMTQGGDGGAMNPDVSKKAGLLRRGKPSNKIGIPLTTEQKIKISKSKYGKKRGIESIRSKPIIKLDKDSGIVLSEYVNITEAGKIYGKRTSINNVLSGRSKTACGFKWEYKK